MGLIGIKFPYWVNFRALAFFGYIIRLFVIMIIFEVDFSNSQQISVDFLGIRLNNQGKFIF